MAESTHETRPPDAPRPADVPRPVDVARPATTGADVAGPAGEASETREAAHRSTADAVRAEYLGSDRSQVRRARRGSPKGGSPPRPTDITGSGGSHGTGWRRRATAPGRPTIRPTG